MSSELARQLISLCGDRLAFHVYHSLGSLVPDSSSPSLHVLLDILSFSLSSKGWGNAGSPTPPPPPTPFNPPSQCRLSQRSVLAGVEGESVYDVSSLSCGTCQRYTTSVLPARSHGSVDKSWEGSPILN